MTNVRNENPLWDWGLEGHNGVSIPGAGAHSASWVWRAETEFPLWEKNSIRQIGFHSAELPFWDTIFPQTNKNRVPRMETVLQMDGKTCRHRLFQSMLATSTHRTNLPSSLTGNANAN
jgi:hypothetical protein